MLKAKQSRLIGPSWRSVRLSLSEQTVERGGEGAQTESQAIWYLGLPLLAAMGEGKVSNSDTLRHS